jgi:cytochrome c553
MKRALRWLGIAVAAIVVLAAVASAGVYVVSERELERDHSNIRGTPVPIPTDSASIAEGWRLARLRGCYDGCHGKTLEGSVMFDEPNIARFVAPNLTKVVRRYSDADLERVIRHGVRDNGRSTFIMPSSMFYHLSDRDLGNILAFIKSQPEVSGPDIEITVRVLGRVGLATKQYRPVLASIDESVPRMTVDTANPVAFGKYLVTTVCTECHGMDLRGERGAANLHIIAPTYSAADFTTLMRTGKASGNRQLGLMSEVALNRFKYFTDREVEAVYAYLQTIPREQLPAAKP